MFNVKLYPEGSTLRIGNNFSLLTSGNTQPMRRCKIMAGLLADA